MSEQTQNDLKEIRLKGLAASPGVALGKAFLYNKRKPIIASRFIQKNQVDEHLSEFRRALDLAVKELEELLTDDLDDETVQIIHAQVAMVNDPELCDQVERLISDDLCSAEYAVQQAFESYLSMLSASDNHVARERLIDVQDTRDRLIQFISNQAAAIQLENDQILVARELSPRQVIKLSGGKVKGIIMDRGGPTSHAAIIARAIGIPAVVGSKRVSELARTNGLVALDGDEGTVIINPSSKTVEKLNKKIAGWSKHISDLKSICNKPSITSDGHPFIIRANVEFTQELPNVKSFNADGIGLLRTESIYLNKQQFENQEKQEKFYTAILKESGEAPVIIRLFDAGGDKFFNIGDKEGNPFLGWRGIRMLLDEYCLLREQLKAIFLAAGKFPGRANILVPMVTNVTEIVALKEHISYVQKQLKKEGHDIDPDIQLGIMIEVPSVAILADRFAEHVDFFSIGTNDLTQYTLAVDRGNELISNLFNQRHPAIWHMIKKSVDAAKHHNLNISVCGELASDPEAAACLMGMGVKELSMSPVKIPRVKELLVQSSYQQMKDLSSRVLECTTVEDVNELFQKWKTQN